MAIRPRCDEEVTALCKIVIVLKKLNIMDDDGDTIFWQHVAISQADVMAKEYLEVRYGIKAE